MSRVGVESDDGLASFYHIMNNEVVRVAGDLERFEKNIAEVNRCLKLEKRKKRLEGRLEGKLERDRDLVIKWIKKGKSDGDIVEYLEITVEELQVIKDSPQ